MIKFGFRLTDKINRELTQETTRLVTNEQLAMDDPPEASATRAVDQLDIAMSSIAFIIVLYGLAGHDPLPQGALIKMAIIVGLIVLAELFPFSFFGADHELLMTLNLAPVVLSWFLLPASPALVAIVIGSVGTRLEYIIRGRWRDFCNGLSVLPFTAGISTILLAGHLQITSPKDIALAAGGAFLCAKYREL